MMEEYSLARSSLRLKQIEPIAHPIDIVGLDVLFVQDGINRWLFRADPVEEIILEENLAIELD